MPIGLPTTRAAGVFQGLANALAARHFTDAGVAGVVLEDHDVAGEKRAVGAAQVEQHAVVAGHRNNLHAGDDRGFCGFLWVRYRLSLNSNDSGVVGRWFAQRNGQVRFSVCCVRRRR